MNIRWFNISSGAQASRSLSVGAFVLLKKVNDQILLTDFILGAKRSRIVNALGYTDSEFAEAAVELTQKGYLKLSEKKVNITALGVQRCMARTERLKPPHIPRGPGNMA